MLPISRRRPSHEGPSSGVASQIDAKEGIVERSGKQSGSGLQLSSVNYSLSVIPPMRPHTSVRMTNTDEGPKAGTRLAPGPWGRRACPALSAAAAVGHVQLQVQDQETQQGCCAESARLPHKSSVAPPV
eukprot:126195-Chlamydomonas_euryale.AAC.5